MAVVICNETGEDLSLLVTPEGTDGLRVKVFLRVPPTETGTRAYDLAAGEDLAFMKLSERTKVYYDQRALETPFRVTLHRGFVTDRADGIRRAAFILTFLSLSPSPFAN